MSTVEYKYAVLVEWNWQGKTEVLGEKPLAFYVPLLWEATWIMVYSQICLGKSLCAHIVTLNEVCWLLLTFSTSNFHIQNQSLLK